MISNITNEQLKFLETYEGKLREFEILTIVKESLTGQGLETYNKIKKWLDEAADQYLTITGNI